MSGQPRAQPDSSERPRAASSEPSVSVKQAFGGLPRGRCGHWADKYSGGVSEHETADFRAVRGQRRAQPGRTMRDRGDCGHGSGAEPVEGFAKTAESAGMIHRVEGRGPSSLGPNARPIAGKVGQRRIRHVQQGESDGGAGCPFKEHLCPSRIPDEGSGLGASGGFRPAGHCLFRQRPEAFDLAHRPKPRTIAANRSSAGSNWRPISRPNLSNERPRSRKATAWVRCMIRT